MVLRLILVATSIGALFGRVSAADASEPQHNGPARHAAFAAGFEAGPHEAIADRGRSHRDDPLALDVVADWMMQDGCKDEKGVSDEIIEAVLSSLDATAAPYREWLGALRQSHVSRDDPRWVELYLAACHQRRLVRLQFHREQLRRVVFTKHYDLGGSHYAYTEAQSDAQNERNFVPGAALCLLELNEGAVTVRALLEDQAGVIRDPDTSADGKRILFSWKKSLTDDDYHLYEMTVANGQIRQLTSGLGYADYEGTYLPGGDIVFNSTRCVQTVDCWWTEVSNLFTCDGDGGHLRQLTFDQVHTNYPTVTDDGRVIYTRWDYNDRGQIYPQGLFQMNPDGTGQSELYGNNSWFPTSVLHARGIPGTSKVICVFSGHHTMQQGWLGILDPAKGRQENQGAQLIAPVRETPAVRVDMYGQSGDQFQYPYALSETEYLVSFRPEGAERFGIFWMSIDGQRELLVADPDISCNQPVPLGERAEPPVRPSAVDYRTTSATVYVQDVHQGAGLAGIERRSAQSLRVVALEFRAAGIGSNLNHGPAGDALASTPISIEGAWDVKTILGTAKIHEDGSACFTVPARTPIYFQVLDGNDQMIQTMRSWVSLQPGETVACIGCHENKNAVPAVSAMTQALQTPPQALQPFYGPPRGFSFVCEIQPILDTHCVRCHYVDETPRYIGYAASGTEQQPGASTVDETVRPAFSLRGVQTLELESQRKWSDSYRALADRRVANWINIQSAPPMLPPYHAGASQSRLSRMLADGSHFGIRLSKAELDRFNAWIDLLVPYCGDYTEAMNDKHVPYYRHFLDKRRRWQAEEATNIRSLVRQQDRGRTAAPE